MYLTNFSEQLCIVHLCLVGNTTFLLKNCAELTSKVMVNMKHRTRMKNIALGFSDSIGTFKFFCQEQRRKKEHHSCDELFLFSTYSFLKKKKKEQQKQPDFIQKQKAWICIHNSKRKGINHLSIPEVSTSLQLKYCCLKHVNNQQLCYCRFFIMQIFSSMQMNLLLTVLAIFTDYFVDDD